MVDKDQPYIQSSKQLPNSFSWTLDGFAENRQLLPFYHENVDMTLINQLVNDICPLEPLSTLDT